MSSNEQINNNEAGLQDKYLTFYLGKESYGIEIKFVTEIIGIQDITNLPDMPNFIKGIINLRGITIPVMDLRLRFNMPSIEYGARTCIIVIKIDDIQFGFIVDTVSEVLDIQEDEIDNPSANKFSGKKKYISGIGKVNDKVIILLDINKILSEEEILEIQEIE